MGVLSEIINPALIRTRNGRMQSLSPEDSSEAGDKAKDLFDEAVRMAYGMYPWPFLTTTAQLESVETNNYYESERYTYAYPADALHIWDFYEFKDRCPEYPVLYNNQRYYSPLSYPFAGYGDRDNPLGTITREGFRSDHTIMHCLYTPKPPGYGGDTPLYMLVDITPWSTQLREWVKSEIKIGLEEGHSTDAEMSLAMIAKHEKRKDTMQTQAAVENRKAYKLEKPDILGRMRGIRR